MEQTTPLLHSPDSAAKRLSISLRAVYANISSGDLKSFKVGKRRLIAEAELQNFVAKKMAEGKSV